MIAQASRRSRLPGGPYPARALCREVRTGPVRDTGGPCARRGFTLIELLLVLAVLVIVAGMAWPVLDRLMTSERLARSADRVRARWTAARSGAIESGRILAFRYEPSGGCYRLELQDDLTEDQDGPAELLPPAVRKLPIDETLPDGIRFVASADAELSDAVLDQLASGQSGAPADATLSEPILFFPDGTCSGAHLSLADNHGWSVELRLRSLTGVVTVARPQRSEEPLP